MVVICISASMSAKALVHVEHGWDVIIISVETFTKSRYLTIRARRNIPPCARIVWYRDYKFNLHSRWLLHTLIAVMRKSLKSDNTPNFSVQMLLISSMSADHELEVSLTPLIAANNSH